MFNLVVQFFIKEIWEFLTYLLHPLSLNIYQLREVLLSAPPVTLQLPNSSINSLKSSVVPERPVILFNIPLVSTVQDIFFHLFLEQR